VADEGSDVATGDRVFDLRVYHVREESDAVFEECCNLRLESYCGLEGEDHTVGNVHDTTSVLHDTTVRVMLHFTDAVEHAVAGNTGVGVDDENVVADADVAWRC